MLGMGSMELVVIMIIAFVVFGPERLAEIAGQGGRALRDFRRMTREMTGEFEASISDVRGAMDEMQTTVADVQRETRDMAASVAEITDSAAAEVRTGAKPTIATADRRPVAATSELSARAAAMPTREDPLADLGGLDDG